MKKLILIIFLSLNFQVLANDLTTIESDELSTSLDNTCGDSWCEGDFNWSVDDFNCSFADQTCTVKLTLIDEFYIDEYTSIEEFETKLAHVEKSLNVDTDTDVDYAAILWEQTCTIKNISNKQDLFYNSNNTDHSNDVYYQVLDCVSEIEEGYWKVEESINN
jgi:hypothetical protein